MLSEGATYENGEITYYSSFFAWTDIMESLIPKNRLIIVSINPKILTYSWNDFGIDDLMIVNEN